MRQDARAARRAAKGLAAKQISNPGGARHARTDGVPLQAYRHDRLSRAYHRTRTDHAADARAASEAKHHRARDIAARIVASHGNAITVEDCTISTCIDLTDPDDPRTARVDYTLAHALRAGLASQKEREGSVNRHQPPTAHDGIGPTRTGSHHQVASAEQAALGPPPNRPGTPGRRGTSRKQQHPKLFGAA
jgi:hypothetical protein